MLCGALRTKLMTSPIIWSLMLLLRALELLVRIWNLIGRLIMRPSVQPLRIIPTTVISLAYSNLPHVGFAGGFLCRRCCLFQKLKGNHPVNLHPHPNRWFWHLIIPTMILFRSFLDGCGYQTLNGRLGRPSSKFLITWCPLHNCPWKMQKLLPGSCGKFLGQLKKSVPPPSWNWHISWDIRISNSRVLIRPPLVILPRSRKLLTSLVVDIPIFNFALVFLATRFSIMVVPIHLVSLRVLLLFCLSSFESVLQLISRGVVINIYPGGILTSKYLWADPFHLAQHVLSMAAFALRVHWPQKHWPSARWKTNMPKKIIRL